MTIDQLKAAKATAEAAIAKAANEALAKFAAETGFAADGVSIGTMTRKCVGHDGRESADRCVVTSVRISVDVGL